MSEKRESRKTRRLPRTATKQEAVQVSKIEAAEELIPKELEAAAAVPEEMIPPIPKPAAGAWKPVTQTGRDVANGKITDISQLFETGQRITEPAIVDALVPGLENDIILIGGSTGKGGGIRRTPSKRTTRMHKSGRRYRISVMVVVGNRNGYVGLGFSGGLPSAHREVVEKALAKAKLNIIPVRRGCGSWECKCGGSHSIPFAVTGKAGSVRIKLMPAPRGLGLAVSDEVKKVMKLAGIRDVWCKSRGQTQSRVNLIKAVFDALRKLDAYRVQPSLESTIGLKTGRVE
ncbi:MAG: 30S ribosomal protein S5 [Candidatus Aenigmatarchaeota archaeon]|nr:30S ribosomal protein S5 [Candidatus Aenigmarchaeota archaeon]